ncbi:MAG TPA: ankyrin repeat domain-containing protein [Gammaproteobacteria bacterium]|jgi:ankyrin repeat protein|nr:ankyrin repeat domain-containing protein [Gammaproteobacteria bacterium]
MLSYYRQGFEKILWQRAYDSLNLSSGLFHTQKLIKALPEDYKAVIEADNASFNEEKISLPNVSVYTLDEVDCQGNTLLIKAVCYGKIAIAELLLEHKAYLHILNDAKQSALDFAVKHQNIPLIKILYEQGAKFNYSYIAPLFFRLSLKKSQFLMSLSAKGIERICY